MKSKQLKNKLSKPEGIFFSKQEVEELIGDLRELENLRRLLRRKEVTEEADVKEEFEQMYKEFDN